MKALLSLPHIGQVEDESRRSAFVGASEGGIDVILPPCLPMSLLGHGFNSDWCLFENDPSFDLFIMLHADHAPVGAWIDVLHRDSAGFGVMHAVAAIKDPRGLTTTAGGLSNRPFGIQRRLSTAEVQRLPMVFGIEDMDRVWGGEHPDVPEWCMLPNTGVMLVKREGFPFAEFDGFNIDSRIIRVENRAIPIVESEDWRFGRFCAKNGVRVGGTRNIVTRHYGRAEFRTDGAWGTDQFDREFMTEWMKIGRKYP